MILTLILTSLPGPIAYLIYKALYTYGVVSAVRGFSAAGRIGIVTSSLSFTMLGLLAAVITLLYGLASRYAVQKYNADGRMKVFFIIYFYSLFTLIGVFVTAVVALPGNVSPWWLKASVILSFNAMAQVALIITILTMLAKRSLSYGGGIDTTGRGPS